MQGHLWPPGLASSSRPEPGALLNLDSDQAENLVACWPLWESAGLGVFDAVRGGACKNTSVFGWASDRDFGLVPAFLTSQGIDLNTPGVTTLVKGGAYTVSVWALAVNPSSPIRQDVMGDNAGGGGGTGVNIGFGTGAATGNIGAAQTTVGGVATNLDSGIAAVANTWYHIVASWDATTAADCRKIHVNGVLAASGTYTGNLGGTALGVGKGGISAQFYLTGRAFDLRIYRGTRTDRQVWALFDPATRFDLYRPPPRAGLLTTIFADGVGQAAGTSLAQSSGFGMAAGRPGRMGSLWPPGTSGDARPDPGTPIHLDSDQAENLVAYWPLREGGGLGVLDEIRGVACRNTSAFTWTPDRDFGPVPALVGPSQFIDPAAPGITTLVKGGAYTVSVWARATNPASPIRQDIVGDNAAGQAGQGVNIGFGTAGVTGNIGATQTTTGGLVTNLDSGIAAVANTWYHIVVTWDGTLAADGRKIYVGGVLAAAGAWTAGVLGGTGLGIGRGGLAPNTYALTGRVFDLRIYKGAKAPDQIAALFASATRYDLHRPPRRAALVAVTGTEVPGEGIGLAQGTSVAVAAAQTLLQGTATAAGLAVVSGVGTAVASQPSLAGSAGVGLVLGIGASRVARVATAAGTGTGTGIGRALVMSTASAMGTSTGSGVVIMPIVIPTAMHCLVTDL